MNNNQFLFTTDNSNFNSSSLEDISLSTTEEEDKLPNTQKLKKIKKSKNNIETNNENNISSLTNQYKLHQPSGINSISRTDYKTFNLKYQEETNDDTQEETSDDTQEETTNDNSNEENNDDSNEETNDYDSNEETNDYDSNEENNDYDSNEENNDDNTDGLEFNNMNDLMSNFNGIFNMMFNNKNLLDERINFNEIQENVNKMFGGNNNIEFDMSNILNNINMNDINIENIMNNIENNDIVEINEKSLKSENSLDDFLEYKSDDNNSNELEDFLE